MSDLNVSLRLGLVNNLSAPAKSALDSLRSLRDGALRLAGLKGGQELARDLKSAAGAAGQTAGALRSLARTNGQIAVLDRSIASLKSGMERTGSASQNTTAAIDRLTARRAKLQALASAAGSLAAQTSRAADATAKLVREQSRTTRGSVGVGAARPLASSGATSSAASVGLAGALGGNGATAVAAGAIGTAVAGAAAVKDFAAVERRMTRVGITAGASREEMRAVTAEAQKMAIQLGMSFDDIAGGYEALAAQGRKMKDIRAFMPAVAKAAQASGAATADIANTAGAIGQQLEIGGDRMQAAFDILIAGGKAGKFELKEMSRYLPSIAPAFAVLGYRGEEGLRKLVAMLQVIREQTGTSEEAATSLRNIFTKMESDETDKNFGDDAFGMDDFRERMEKARREGKDMLDTLEALTREALKGDLSKIPRLFKDEQLQAGMRALLSQPGAVARLVREFRSVDGSTVADLNRVLDDSKTKIDALSASWQQLKTSAGAAIATMGGVTVLEQIGKGLRNVEDAVQGAREGRADKTVIGRNLNRAIDHFTGTFRPDQTKEAIAKAKADKDLRDAIDRERQVFDDRVAGETHRGAVDARIWGRTSPVGLGYQRRSQERIGKIGAERQAFEALVAAHDELQVKLAEIDGSKRQAGAVRFARPHPGLSPIVPGSFGFGAGGSQTGGEEVRSDVGGRKVYAPAPWRGKTFTPPFMAGQTAPLPPRRPDAITPPMLRDLREVEGAFQRLGDMRASPEVDTASVVAAEARATTAGELIKAALDITVTPKVDTSSIDAASGAAGRLRAQLTGLGGGVSGASARAALAGPGGTLPVRQLAPTNIPPGRPGSATSVTAAIAASRVAASRGDRRQAVASREGSRMHVANVHVHGVTNVAALHKEFSLLLDKRAKSSRSDALHDTGSDFA